MLLCMTMIIWNRDENPALWLLTLDEICKLPFGTTIESIFGSKKVVGVNIVQPIPAFGGCTVYGIRDFEEKIKTDPNLFLFALK